MAGDRVRLRNISLYGHHGVSPAEQELGRRLSVDVELGLDLSRAGKSDDLADTVDYARAYEVVAEANASRRFSLLETLAEEIARRLLAAFPVSEARVRVRKPDPPVGGVVEEVEIEITRRRE
jgi:dihydroneopterin aldolase